MDCDRVPSKRAVVDEFMSIAEFEEISLTFGIGGLILLMMFILCQLSKESGAGKYGTLVISLALAMGVFGFAAKSVIRLIIDA